MTERATHRHPTEIKLHAKSRLLTVGFDDGAVFELPCAYLRVYSKATEVRTSDRPITGKEAVNISAIGPQGQYAIRVMFDDGHATGIFSWDTLYALGRDREQNWADYLGRLERIGYRRQEPDHGERRGKRLYFSWLAKKPRNESDHIILPAAVANVETLLQWLGQRITGRPSSSPPTRCTLPSTGTPARALPGSTRATRSAWLRPPPLHLLRLTSSSSQPLGSRGWCLHAGATLVVAAHPEVVNDRDGHARDE